MEESSTYQEILEEGRAEGRAQVARDLRRSIRELVEARLAALPEGLEGRLSTLDAEALRGLFSRLVRAADAAALERLLAG
jgi:predicted transposase YdaD